MGSFFVIHCLNYALLTQKNSSSIGPTASFSKNEMESILAATEKIVDRSSYNDIVSANSPAADKHRSPVVAPKASTASMTIATLGTQGAQLEVDRSTSRTTTNHASLLMETREHLLINKNVTSKAHLSKPTSASVKNSVSNVQSTFTPEIKRSLSKSLEITTIKEGVAVGVGGGGVGGDGGFAATPVTSSLVIYQTHSISNILRTSTLRSNLYTASPFESLGISTSDEDGAVGAGGGGVDGGDFGAVGGYADTPTLSSVIFNQTYSISNIQPTSAFQSSLYTASPFKSLGISTSDKDSAMGAGGGGVDGGGVGGDGGFAATPVSSSLALYQTHSISNILRTSTLRSNLYTASPFESLGISTSDEDGAVGAGGGGVDGGDFGAVGGYADTPTLSSVILNQTYSISNIQPTSAFQSSLYTASPFESLGISTSDKDGAVGAGGGGVDGGGFGGVGGYADTPTSSSVIFNQTYSISNIQPTSTFQSNLYAGSPFESLGYSTSDKDSAVGAGGGGVDGGGIGRVGGYGDTPTSSSVIFNQTNDISNIQFTSIDHGSLYTASLYKSREGSSSSDTVVVVGAGGGGVDGDGVDGGDVVGGSVGGGGSVANGGHAGTPSSSSVTSNLNSYTSWIDMTPSSSTLASMMLSPTPSQVIEAKSSQALTTSISESALCSSQDVIAIETSSNRHPVWTSVMRKETSSVVASPRSTTEILMMSQTSNGIVEVKYSTSSTVTKDSDGDDKFVRFYG